MKADVGDIVKKGQVLAAVDNEKIRNAVVQAEAGLESARAQYNNVESEWNRVNRLYQENAISKAQYDAATTQLEAARSAVKQLEAGLSTAKNQMNDSYITTPISGSYRPAFLKRATRRHLRFRFFLLSRWIRLKYRLT
jgi:RND family efflux transporter MFP subunit